MKGEIIKILEDKLNQVTAGSKMLSEYIDKKSDTLTEKEKLRGLSHIEEFQLEELKIKECIIWLCNL